MTDCCTVRVSVRHMYQLLKIWQHFLRYSVGNANSCRIVPTVTICHLVILLDLEFTGPNYIKFA